MKHEFIYAPLIEGGTKRYNIDLPDGQLPIRFWTVTSPMLSWNGEVVKTSPERIWAAIRHNGRTVEVNGFKTSAIDVGMPCIVMEHLNINGEMELMIGSINIMQTNKNFVNYGIPGGKHIRIDIYTGESVIINE